MPGARAASNPYIRATFPEVSSLQDPVGSVVGRITPVRGGTVTENASSPRITDISWGRLEAGGGVFKDAKLFPGGAREWDWGETGTRHTPGIQPADVEELLGRGATVVVLAKGFYGRLGVCRETLEMLEDRGVPAYVESTEEAVRLYNGMRREGESVGALIHSTC